VIATVWPNLDICNAAQARLFSGCVVVMRHDLGMPDDAIAHRGGVGSNHEWRRSRRSTVRPV
jgi:hypothetical protein